ncbi:MAG: PKD domain-containing protein [Sphingobacteriales bacterium]|nr:MAG: PKD domain-containing protein [Sphingobacteriales bacterium]
MDGSRLRPRLLLLLLLCATSLTGFSQAVQEFVANSGQWEGAFRYRGRVHADTWVFGEATGLTYSMTDFSGHDHHRSDSGVTHTTHGHAWKMQFVGAHPQPVIRALDSEAHYYNYFLGSDSTRWKSGLHPTHSLQYQRLYTGIDLEVGFIAGQFKYEYHIAAGADPAVIAQRYEGVQSIRIEKGALKLQTSLGAVTEQAPVAWQTNGTVKKKIRCQYQLTDSTVRYLFPDGYDPRLPIVIDPVVVFASFSGSTADNWGFTATYDNAGSFYAGGLVNVTAGQAYPTTPGAFQTTYGGGSPNTGSGAVYSTYPSDISISKFSANGNTLVYGTYIGGSNNEQPHSMVVDTQGNLFIAGRTYSTNYPAVGSSYDNSFNGVADIVVSKLNPTGTALLGSTFLGGSAADGVNIRSGTPSTASTLFYNYGDDARSEIIADRSGNVYVAASSQSTNFPTVNAIQTTSSGAQDAVIFKLDNSLSTLLWSTYYGGSGEDAAYVLTLDTAQTALYVGGGTTSTNFPMPAGGYQPGYQGGRADGFVLRFQNSGTYPVVNGSFIGRGDYDQVYGLQTDYENRIYLMGQTLGGTFPVTPGTYSNPNSNQFIMKMDANLQANLVSTVIGNGAAAQPNISPVAFLVDTCGNIYLSGWGGTLFNENPFSGGMLNMPVTPGAIQTTTDNADFYFIALSKNAGSLLYGTYRGQNGADEHVDGGTSRFDKNGVVYQAICGGCGRLGFPTTQGAYSTTNRSNNCNLVALKIAFELGSVDASANATPATRGCPPLVVNFNNTSVNASQFTWNFGDGSPTDTARNPRHTYTRPGTFRARLVAVNPIACRIADTAYITIVVDSNSIFGDIAVQDLNTCDPYSVRITNNVTVPGSSATYAWTFGDGSSSFSRNPLTHNYTDSGTYTIRLIVTDPAACNSPDTFSKIIQVRALRVKAALSGPDSLCQNAGGITFQSITTNATTIRWTFGDGDTSRQTAPVHTYRQPGTYTVRLIAANPDACNRADTAFKTVRIFRKPTALFDFTPIIPEANTPISFINQSVDADRYRWDFGDGDGSSETSPQHFYKQTGTYSTCLTAISVNGCLDTFCREVVADVRIACDVPTAFSPNGDGKNDILYVRGAAIETLSFRVYNRWGQLLFETDTLTTGWDGTWQGKPQEADAYAYMLSATFIDGTRVRRNGHITLLR